MLLNILGLTMHGSISPYLRKHVLNTLEPSDFLFVNGFIIALLLSVYFIYLYTFDYNILKKTYKNCSILTFSQMAALLMIGTFTIGASILLLDFDKNYNTPAMNFIIIKSISLILLFCIGTFIFREKYSIKQIIGIMLTAIGVLILST